MKPQIHESERGQAIVYLVVGFVAFLAFVALAIDGGMALADRRHSQNAADASSLAGGGVAAEYMETHHVTTFNWNCSTNAAIIHALGLSDSTAISRAGANEFTIASGFIAHNGVVTACGSHNYGGGIVDRYMDVTVEISATTQTNFLQLIYPDALHNEVAAVTRVRPRRPPAFGNAIVALNPAGCNSAGTPGGVMYGSTNIFIEGGGIFSNGCLRGNGNPNIRIDGGPLPLGNEILPGNANWIPAPQETDLQIDPIEFNFGTPDCTGRWMNNLPGSDPTKGEPHLDGLYCMNSNLSINAHDYISGTNVTIYIPNGKLYVNGNAKVELSAPPAGTPYPPAIPGVLFYVPNGQSVELNGTSDSWFRGMIVAPKSEVTLNGTSGNTYQGQVIGWNVNVGGTSDVYIEYHPEDGFTLPTSIELAR